MWLLQSSFISWQKIFLWLKLSFLVPVIAIGGRTFYLYQQLQTFDTCVQTVDFLIEHKTTFLCLYHTKTFQKKLVTLLSSKERILKKGRKKGKKARRPVGQRLALWLEGRLITQLMNDEVKSVKDLPMLDRNVIRAMDGSSYLSSIWRQALCFLTFN